MDSKNTELKAWCDAERGNYTSLANHLQCAVSFVSKMADGEKPIPLDLCDRIEAHTGISCEVLRPDKVDYFAYMRNRPTVEAAVLADMDAMVPVDKAD